MGGEPTSFSALISSTLSNRSERSAVDETRDFVPHIRKIKRRSIVNVF